MTVVADARVEAQVVGDVTRCTTLRSSPPLTFRVGASSLHLVGTMAGPIGGDDLRLSLVIGEGARLSVGSVAANLVLPSPRGHSSQWCTEAAVARGGILIWSLEPTVLVAGCDHRTHLRFELADGASLWWREEVVLGRHGEPGGSLQQRVDLVIGGRPIHRGDLRLGPRWPASSSSATSGGMRCIGTILAVGDRVADLAAPPAAGAGGDVAVHRLAADQAVLVTAVAATVGEVRRLLDRASAFWQQDPAP